MKVIIFGGTTEGRRLSGLLSESGASVTVCVATEYGSEEQKRIPGVSVRTGVLSPEEKQLLLQDAAVCVDATHPYATHITESVRMACSVAGVPYLRLRRQPSEIGETRCFRTAAEAAAWLSGQEGNILLTTGTKDMQAFAEIEKERLFPRILPSHQGLKACEALGIPHRNIIAMQGPFSEEMNIATIRQYNIRFLITKDGGSPGGYPEKTAAACKTGTELILIQRPEDAGADFETVYEMCMTLMKCSNNKMVQKNREEGKET